MDLNPITLPGKIVRLEPLSIEHVDRLCEIGLVDELWAWTANSNKTSDDMRSYVEIALDEMKSGVSLPFVTIENRTNQIIGSTRFGNIEIKNRKVEIGWTWIAPAWQRTAVNTEAKYLMLSHAFETWKCNRVELKTDALNERSRAAIMRIGGKEEGILRNHMVAETGRVRDTVYYSIIDDEWPDVKNRLEAMLHRSYQ